jgi:toxin ParE1/3/4
MGFRIEIRPTAILDATEAYNWYESQKEGLGIEFLDALDSFYDELLINPYTHSFYVNTVRQGVLDRFPYTVVYEVNSDSIVVFSVFMQRRDPSKKRTE